MEFSNTSVDPTALPTLDAATLQPVSPYYPPYRLLSLPLRWTTLLAVFWLLLTVSAAPEPLRNLLVPIALVAVLAITLLGYLEAGRRAYGLREHDLIYRSGLLIRRTAVVPLARIQHVEIASGPLERRFGLVQLNCFTAGGSSGALGLQGLDADTAERVRQYLLSRIRARDAATTSDD